MEQVKSMLRHWIKQNWYVFWDTCWWGRDELYKVVRVGKDYEVVQIATPEKLYVIPLD